MVGIPDGLRAGAQHLDYRRPERPDRGCATGQRRSGQVCGVGWDRLWLDHGPFDLCGRRGRQAGERSAASRAAGRATADHLPSPGKDRRQRDAALRPVAAVDEEHTAGKDLCGDAAGELGKV